MDGPALVVLAAGTSRRLGRCKALVELGGRAAILRLLDAARALEDPRPLVVTGAHHDAIAAALAERPVEVLWNENWAAGRTGGLIAAAAARPGRDLVVAPVDKPLVAAATFARLSRAWRESGSPPGGWLAPRRGASFGHPVVIGRDLAARLGELGPGEPLSRLRAWAASLASVPVEDPAVLDDLDTPADLEKLSTRLARGEDGDPASGDAD